MYSPADGGTTLMATRASGAKISTVFPFLCLTRAPFACTMGQCCGMMFNTIAEADEVIMACEMVADKAWPRRTGCFLPQFVCRAAVWSPLSSLGTRWSAKATSRCGVARDFRGGTLLIDVADFCSCTSQLLGRRCFGTSGESVAHISCFSLSSLRSSLLNPPILRCHRWW